MLVAGRDDLTAIPPGAPTFVTRLAREQLGDAPRQIHEITESRALSAASARELLSFTVRANLAALVGRGQAGAPGS